jgi:hypothetical protein
MRARLREQEDAQLSPSETSFCQWPSYTVCGVDTVYRGAAVTYTNRTPREAGNSPITLESAENRWTSTGVGWEFIR